MSTTTQKIMVSSILYAVFLVSIPASWGQSTAFQIPESTYLLDGQEPKYEEALIAYEATNHTIALKKLTELSLKGNPAATYWLGAMHDQGLGGLPADEEKANALYKSSLIELTPLALNGDPVAQTILGNSFSMGRSVPADENQANFWFDKAIAQGYPQAVHLKAKMHYAGVIKNPDLKKAILLYKQALDMGVAASALDLYQIYSDRDQTALALTYLKKSAEMGFSLAEYDYAYMLDQGELGLKENDVAAVQWYAKAAKHGDERAQNNLGVMYHEGTGVKKSFVKAYALFQLALAQHNDVANCGLGNLKPYISPEDVKAAEKIIQNWKPGVDITQL